MIKQITQSTTIRTGTNALKRYPVASSMAVANPALTESSCITTRNYSILDTAKGALDKLNKGAGKVASEGLDIAEKTAKATTEEVSGAQKKAADALSAANKSSGKVLADGLQAAEDVGEKIVDAKDSVLGKKQHTEQRQRVKKNHSGYKDLQDKGSKTESEQNRPDDAV